MVPSPTNAKGYWERNCTFGELAVISLLPGDTHLVAIAVLVQDFTGAEAAAAAMGATPKRVPATKNVAA